MNKGVNFAAFDFRRALVELVNGSELPAVCLRYELEGVVRQVKELEQQATAAEREAWEKAPVPGEEAKDG